MFVSIYFTINFRFSLGITMLMKKFIGSKKSSKRVGGFLRFGMFNGLRMRVV